MKAFLRVRRETVVHERDFKERGLDNVKLQVKHANFAPEKDRAARRWIMRQETHYQRLGIYVAVGSALVAVAAIYLKK